MTDNVIQFIPRPNPNRREKLERDALEIMNVALMGDAGLFSDTAPSDMPFPFVAPDDCA